MTTTTSMRLLAAVLALAFSAAASAADLEPAKKPVPVLQTWKGTMKKAELRAAAPADRFIADQKTWEALWAKWFPNDKVPAVDFSKNLVLVETVDGPNMMGGQPTLDGKGNVELIAMATLMAGPGFGYLMEQISREGIKTVNGKPLPEPAKAE